MGTNRSVYSHRMMLMVILVQVVSLAARWYGGLPHIITYFGMGLVGIALLSYTAYWDPPPAELRSKRIQLVVMSILVATLFNRW